MKATIQTEDGRVFTGELIKEKTHKRERVKKDCFYFYIDYNGDINFSKEIRHSADDYRHSIGNYYITEEEAKEKGINEVKKTQAIVRVKDYIMDNFGEFEPNWSDTHQWKYSIKGIIKNKDFGIDLEYESTCYIKQYSPFGYLRSEEHAQQLINDCEEDLKIIFDIK